MHVVREISPGVFTELLPDQTITVLSNGEESINYPGSIVNNWNASDLADIGIYLVADAVVPTGQQARGSHYEWQDGSVVQVLDLETIVPASITRRQMIMGLNQFGFISAEEAIAAATTGALPAFVAGYFNQLPEPDRTNAIVTWAAMSVCERNNPILLAMAQIANLTPEQIDLYFIQASAL